MADKKISVTFTTNNSEFNRNLKETQNSIKQTGAELQKAGADINKYGSNLQTLGQRKQALTTQINNFNDKIKIYGDSIEKNNSKIDTNKSKLTELEATKKKLTAEYEKSVQMYGKESDEALKAKEALDKCNQEYSKAEGNIKKAENAVQKHTTEVIKAEAEVSKLEAELQQCNQAIAEQSNKFLQASKSFEEWGNKLQSAGGKMSDIGGNLMKLSAPMVAFSGYAVKASIDFEASMSNVKAISGASAQDMDLLSEKAKEMGKTTSKSAKDAGDAMGYMALAGWDTQQIISGIAPVLALAEAGNLDLAYASDLVTDSMSALQLETSDLNPFLDKMATTSQKSNTSIQQLGEAFLTVGGTATVLSGGVTEMSTVLGIFADNGIKGAEGGTALRNVILSLSAPTDKASKLLSDLGISAFDSEGKMRPLNETFKDLNSKLADMDDQKRTEVLSELFNKVDLKSVNALLANSGARFDELSGYIDNSNGSLEKLSKTMQDNTKGNIEKLKSSLEGLGIQIGENLLPHINNFIDKLSELIAWFGGLDEGTQQAIVQFGLFTFATGGLLKAVGSVTSGIGGMATSISSCLGWLGSLSTGTTVAGTAMATAGGTTGAGALASGLTVLSGVALPVVATLGTLATVAYAYHEAQDVLNQDITVATEEMSIMERAMGQLLGVQSYSKDELVEMGLVYKDWNENVSPQTAQALDNVAEKIRNVTLAVEEVNFDGIITEEEVNQISLVVDDMCSSIIETIKSRQDESNRALLGMFETNGVDEKEQEIIDIINGGSNSQIEIVEEKNKRIKEIAQKAHEENRAINEQEQAEINRIQEELAQISLDNIVLNNEEKLAVQAEFITRTKDLDAQGTSEYLTQKKQAIDEEKQAIQQKYDEGITALELYLANCSDSERASIEEQIRLKTEERDRYLKVEDEKWNAVMQSVNNGNQNIAKNINKFNGELLTKQDLQKQETLKQMKSQYDGIDQIASSGLKKVYDNTSKTYRDVYFEVDKSTGEIIGCYDTYSGKVGGYTEDISKNVAKMGQNASKEYQAMMRDIENLGKGTVNSSGEIVDGYGKVIGKVDELKTHADGTRTGLINLNGTPVEVKINSQGAISNLDEVKRKVDNLPLTKVISVKVNSSGLKALNHASGSSGTPEGFANVNERGWEIIDTPSGNPAINLANALSGEMTYLEAGTKVSTHLASTATMQREVSGQVNRQMQDAISIAVKSMGIEIRRALEGGKSSQAVGGEVTFNNNYTVNTKTEFDVKNLEDNIEYNLKKQLKASGKRW